MQQTTPPVKQNSPWAVAALMLSLVVLCPLATVLGPLLGLKAIADIRAVPGLKGKGYAVAAIIIGVTTTIGWFAAAAWLNASIRQPILNGPVEYLQSGFRGDIAGFKDGFDGSAAQVPDDQVVRFINELTRRYGVFNDMQLAPADSEVDPPDPDTVERIVPYVLTFDRGLIEADAAFVAFEGIRFIGKWRWILIHDDELGDLKYPP